MAPPPKQTTVVRTSEPDWLERAIRQYGQSEAFELEDDAALGLQEVDVQSAIALIKAAKKHRGVPWRNIAAALTGLGISTAGIWMVAAAIADPEPTSKLGLLVGGGVVLALTGGVSTLAALGVRVSVTASGRGFSIRPGEKPS